jgi:hypothetical protein
MSAVTEQHGWVGERGDRTAEPTYAPDMAAILDGDGDDQESELAACGEVMRSVFGYVFDVHKDKNGLPRLDLAFRKFCCVVWLLRPELLGNMSQAQLAPHLGACRATLSKAIRLYGDAHGIRNALQKRESARAIYRDAQLNDHWRNRPKKKPDASCETPGPHDEQATNGHLHSEDRT